MRIERDKQMRERLQIVNSISRESVNTQRWCEREREGVRERKRERVKDKKILKVL